MQIIIDIPNCLYANLAEISEGSIANKRILDSVKSGTPLDDVKAGMKSLIDWHDCPIELDGGNDSWYCQAVNQCLEIIDNIGKAESEEV